MTKLYRIRALPVPVYAVTPDIGFERLNMIKPQLRVVLDEFEKRMSLCGDVVYTSILRPADTDSVHAFGRGADVRLWHPDRGLEFGEMGAGLPADPDALDYAWFRDTLEELRGIYGHWAGKDGKEHEVFYIHGDGLNKHIHIQAPGRAWR